MSEQLPTIPDPDEAEADFPFPPSSSPSAFPSAPLPPLYQTRSTPSSAPPPPRSFFSTGRLGVLFFLLVLLVVVLLVPQVARWIAYSIQRGQEEAKAEVARKLLRELGDIDSVLPWVAKSAAPSVVGIQTLERGGSGTGSGVIVDPEGYLLTNIHVVANAEYLSVLLSDGREITDVTLVGHDPFMDLAVLKIPPPRDGSYIAMPWGESSRLEVGETVLAVGSPFGLAQTVTSGIISAKERYGPTATGDLPQEYLQTDAAINPGNSGGPLVNLRGELVGINTAIISGHDSQAEQFSGVGLAIPSDLAKKVYEQIRKGGKMVHSWIGASLLPLDKEAATVLGMEDTPGVRVARVLSGAPAHKAGLQRNDVIVSVDGKKVVEPTPFIHTIIMTEPGTTLRLGIIRDRMLIEVDVVAEKRPVNL